ncbi:MAG: MoaD/ThiS family protein [Hyphomonadaceae bacterium]|nr:MoaD/ThiS family protein [Hyphomonadaceae bacterium]
MARVMFFGRLRDIAQCSERPVPFDGALSLDAFRRLVASGDDDLARALQADSTRVAVNATIAPRSVDLVIHPGDDVAFMPPFSGG